MKTTDLEKIRNGEPFTWGKVIAIHDIGRYTLLEYLGRAYQNCHATGKLEEKSTFHIYVDGVSTSSGASSLESGLIHAIAIGRLEINAARWMAIAANKLLGTE